MSQADFKIIHSVKTSDEVKGFLPFDCVSHLKQIIKSIPEDQRFDIDLPSEELLQFTKTFFDKFPEVFHLCVDADIDNSGGILLEFQGGIELGISFHPAFYPSFRGEMAKKYYEAFQDEEMVAEFFKRNEPIESGYFSTSTEQCSFELAA